MNDLALPDVPDLTPLIELVTDTVSSEHTRRAYRRALEDFIGRVRTTGQPGLTRATVQRYRREMEAMAASPSSINQRLSAIRKLAAEAADNDLISQSTAQAIARVKGARREGRRLGNWLTLNQAQAMINAPDITTAIGKGDRAILAVLIGCGLHRAEAVSLRWDHIQQRAGRWVIVDLVGKRKKVRSIPRPAWVKAALDAWGVMSGDTGPVFRSMNKGGKVLDQAMTTQAIYYVVGGYAASLGLDIAPHDLRRTYAKLAHAHGAPLEQVQINLGHASIQTTERYLGVELDLVKAAGDYIPIRLE